MDVGDMILISIDDHVIEPRDMFAGHVPDRWKDEAPRSVTNAKGMERWVFQDIESGSGSLNTVVGWPKKDWGMDPTTYAEMRPGAYDINERVRDMDHNGILASMCFPSFVGFSGGFFQRSPDKDLGPGDDPGLQRLAHRRVGGRISGSLHPVGHSADLGSRSAGRTRSDGWPRRAAVP